MSSYTQSDQPTNQASSKAAPGLEIPDLAIALPLPANVAVSLTTLPLLAVIVTGQIAARTLIQWGSSSEELFRGSRLPTVRLLTAQVQIE
ncbi:hypothetical protein S7335_3990 [Synechococcus sp. PCC 7335]|uniref:hypothetical protein n=1 Tax=Synechococcus sp. (strain ATCC 29403 / PCC 7335) TaxID=91464 RepID=UPI00017ED250|nr:hypothetical protein [Synechococcus sp. PCC 7335]EDX86287.1 hypothetical protein S7335_3990 [Synechococcus sp. PCC 7335]